MKGGKLLKWVLMARLQNIIDLVAEEKVVEILEDTESL